MKELLERIRGSEFIEKTSVYPQGEILFTFKLKQTVTDTQAFY